VRRVILSNAINPAHRENGIAAGDGKKRRRGRGNDEIHDFSLHNYRESLIFTYFFTAYM
jgi:hypothetical protein